MRTGAGFARWCPALLALAVCTAAAARADVALREGWVAETPPAALATAAYGVLANGSDEAIELVGVSSPACERVEIHRTIDAGGVARMERVERLALAAGEEVRFEPGGMHWMLIRPRSLASGEEVAIVLEFADGSRSELRLPVRSHGHHAPH